jgi:hypothetical protein
VTRFIDWLIRLAVWLACMDAMSWLLGVRWWQAMLIGLVGVMVEEFLVTEGTT